MFSLETELRTLCAVDQHSIVSSSLAPLVPALIPLQKLFQVFPLLLQKSEAEGKTLRTRQTLMRGYCHGIGVLKSVPLFRVRLVQTTVCSVQGVHIMRGSKCSHISCFAPSRR